jgi:hypothetical protein
MIYKGQLADVFSPEFIRRINNIIASDELGVSAMKLLASVVTQYDMSVRYSEVSQPGDVSDTQRARFHYKSMQLTMLIQLIAKSIMTKYINHQGTEMKLVREYFIHSPSALLDVPFNSEEVRLMMRRLEEAILNGVEGVDKVQGVDKVDGGDEK